MLDTLALANSEEFYLGLEDPAFGLEDPDEMLQKANEQKKPHFMSVCTVC